MALNLRQKAGWGLADMGIVVFVVVKQLLVLAFLTAVMGVPVGVAGAVTTGVLLFDIVSDPAIGYFSDRSRSRWGRRAPWMVVGAVVMAAAMWALFAVPDGLGQGAVIAWVTMFFGLATIGFTMVAIPYSAMAGEITRDPRERSHMTAWRMGFASVGILIGGALIPGLAAGMGYAGAALAVAPLIVGAIWLSVWLTRDTPRIAEPATAGLGEMLALVVANRAFVVLVLLYGVMTLAVALITAGLPFAAIYLVQDTGDTALSGVARALTVLSTMFAAFVVGSILSQAAWAWASGRIGKLAALCVGLALYAALLVWLYLSLPATSVTVIAGLFVLAGMTNGAYQQIPWAMYPDLIDATRDQSGQPLEGAFSSVWLFGQKVANALAPLALGQVLAFWGWQEATGEVVVQTPQALAALQVSITLLPAAILLIAMAGLVILYAPRAARAGALA